MRIAFQYFGDSSGKINEFVGGEARLSSNIYNILQSAGHDVAYVQGDQDEGFDLYLDAPWEICDRLKSKRHVHFSFAYYDAERCQDMLRQPCARNGCCFVGHPYKIDQIKSLRAEMAGNPYHFLFMPMPFDDCFRPANTVSPFQRTEIAWATKFWSDPVFDDPNHVQHYYVQNAVNTLQALVRLNQRTDFKMNFIMSESIEQANPRHNIPGLVSQLRDVSRLGRLPWTDLIQIMGKSKLNLPIGGLQASVLESIFGEALPILYSDTRYCATSKEICLLPAVKEATAQEIYEALEAFWFDECLFWYAWEYYQDLFKDHTREGFLFNFDENLAKMGMK